MKDLTIEIDSLIRELESFKGKCKDIVEEGQTFSQLKAKNGLLSIMLKDYLNDIEVLRKRLHAYERWNIWKRFKSIFNSMAKKWGDE